jgi:hypothetical protein
LREVKDIEEARGRLAVVGSEWDRVQGCEGFITRCILNLYPIRITFNTGCIVSSVLKPLVSGGEFSR